MTRKAGSIVLDRLRERILVGTYFGCWSAGDRLPSVRTVAEGEGVDRKTAAAAYRELEREGLVRVEARSGVYLEAPRETTSWRDPLRRLHMQWLENTLAAATELGLDAKAANRLLQAVGAVQRRRIPVVDEDTEHACLIADELADRAEVECSGCGPDAIPAESGPLKDAPFVVATPSIRARFRSYQKRLPVVAATLDPRLLDETRELASRGDVLLVAGTRGLARELERAVDHGLVNGNGSRVTVVRARTAKDLEEASSRVSPGATVVVWPGVSDAAGDDGAVRWKHLLADSTLRSIRRQLARSALEHVSTSTAVGSR